MILGILLINCIGHNCNDIILKITCNLHDKCIWNNGCKYPTTTSSSSINDESFSSKKKTSSKKKYSSDYETSTSSTKKSSKSTSSSTPSSTSSSTSSSTFTSTTSKNKISSSTLSSTPSSTPTIIIPNVNEQRGKMNVGKNIVAPIIGVLFFAIILALVIRRKNKNHFNRTVMENLRYEEPVVMNSVYELASENNGATEELYEEPVENALYDLAYENPRSNYDLAN